MICVAYLTLNGSELKMIVYIYIYIVNYDTSISD